jgi:glycosyltransferase involved in cell wall biosynthesis
MCNQRAIGRELQRGDASLVGRNNMMAPMSVVLATYNGAKHLSAQLESLAQQSLLPQELVVGDDGSDDATVALLDEFATSAPFPVRTIARPTRLGAPDNFLSSARFAAEPLVAFCDQDDIWSHDKLERVVAASTRSPDVVLVAHHADVVGASARPVGRIFPRDELSGRYEVGALPLGFYPGFVLTVRRCLLYFASPDERPRYSEQPEDVMGHDAWVWMLAACGGESVILPERLVAYRQDHNLYGDLHVDARERIRRVRSADADTYVAQVAQKEALAEYLATLASSWRESGHRERASHALRRAARYRLLASRERAGLYLSSSRRAAMVRWVGMVRSGVYQGRKQDGLGILSAAKDAVRSIVGIPAPGSGRIGFTW